MASNEYCDSLKFFSNLIKILSCLIFFSISLITSKVELLGVFIDFHIYFISYKLYSKTIFIEMMYMCFYI